MKKMLTLFAVILAIGLGAPIAEAKKFGGGKSFGKSYKTAPAQPAAKPVDTKNPTVGAQAPKKGGMMGGLFGALATGIFASSSLGGIGYAEGMSMGGQLLAQVTGIGGVALWSVIGSAIVALMVSMVFPMRVDEQTERDGLDIASHGERAWEMD